ncbi:MAG: SIS domain-containing protein [Patescibacteria group bacterium]
MYDAIANAAEQLLWKPEIERPADFSKLHYTIVAGMGGSALAADLIPAIWPEIKVVAHRDYGLPFNTQGALVIASSYSGNTEEVIDAFRIARKEKLPAAAVATGGELARLAEAEETPLVRIPATNIQPRAARGYSIQALLALMGRDREAAELTAFAKKWDPRSIEEAGKRLASRVHGKVPIIYTSERNRAIGYNWKIVFNETAKIPAFANTIPEQNHNEINAFDNVFAGNAFAFVILRDAEDHPRVARRMEVLEKILLSKGWPVEVVTLEGTSRVAITQSALTLGDWTGYHTAILMNHDPDAVPAVEAFKKML